MCLLHLCARWSYTYLRWLHNTNTTIQGCGMTTVLCTVYTCAVVPHRHNLFSKLQQQNQCPVPFGACFLSDGYRNPSIFSMDFGLWWIFFRFCKNGNLKGDGSLRTAYQVLWGGRSLPVTRGLHCWTQNLNMQTRCCDFYRLRIKKQELKKRVYEVGPIGPTKTKNKNAFSFSSTLSPTKWEGKNHCQCSISLPDTWVCVVYEYLS